MPNSLPKKLHKYFWGDNLSQLNWNQYRQYITQTILEKGDREAVAWLFKNCSKSELKSQIPAFKLSPKSKNFWQIYLSA